MNCLRIVRTNFKRSLNRRTGFLVNLLIPIFVVIIGILANSVSKPSYTIGIIDGNKAQNIVNTLTNTSGFTVAKANVDSIPVDLITGKFSYIVEFSNADFEVFTIKDQDTNKKFTELIQSYQTTNHPSSVEAITGAQMSLPLRTIAFIVLFLMVTATVNASLMIEDKNTGVLERYNYSPQKTSTYVLGNYFFNFLITYFQYFIAISIMQLVSVNIGINYITLLILGLLISGIATAFGTFFASIFKMEMYANLSATFISLILSLIGGTFIAFNNMPDLLQKLSFISPFRWFIVIVNNLENGMSLSASRQQILVLCLFITVMLFFSYAINRIKLERK